MRLWWICIGYFWFVMLLMMIWFYCWLFRVKIGKIYYILKKKMYKSVIFLREVDIIDFIVVLLNNVLFLVGFCVVNN